MESANLKYDSPDDAQLEAWLRAQSAVPPLADEGFSQRVLATLPPPQPLAGSNLRQWLCFAAAIAGGAIAFSTRPHSADVSQKFAELLPSLRAAASSLSEPSAVFALLATVGSLAFVYWRQITAKLNILN